MSWFLLPQAQSTEFIMKQLRESPLLQSHRLRLQAGRCAENESLRLKVHRTEKGNFIISSERQNDFHESRILSINTTMLLHILSNLLLIAVEYEI